MKIKIPILKTRHLEVLAGGHEARPVDGPRGLQQSEAAPAGRRLGLRRPPLGDVQLRRHPLRRPRHGQRRRGGRGRRDQAAAARRRAGSGLRGHELVLARRAQREADARRARATGWWILFLAFLWRGVGSSDGQIWF